MDIKPDNLPKINLKTSDDDKTFKRLQKLQSLLKKDENLKKICK